MGGRAPSPAAHRSAICSSVRKGGPGWRDDGRQFPIGSGASTQIPKEPLNPVAGWARPTLHIKFYWNPAHPLAHIVCDCLLPAAGAMAELSCDGVPAKMSIFTVCWFQHHWLPRPGQPKADSKRAGKGFRKERAWLGVSTMSMKSWPPGRSGQGHRALWPEERELPSRRDVRPLGMPRRNSCCC